MAGKLLGICDLGGRKEKDLEGTVTLAPNGLPPLEYDPSSVLAKLDLDAVRLGTSPRTYDDPTRLEVFCSTQAEDSGDDVKIPESAFDAFHNTNNYITFAGGEAA